MLRARLTKRRRESSLWPLLLTCWSHGCVSDDIHRRWAGDCLVFTAVVWRKGDSIADFDKFLIVVSMSRLEVRGRVGSVDLRAWFCTFKHYLLPLYQSLGEPEEDAYPSGWDGSSMFQLGTCGSLSWLILMPSSVEVLPSTFWTQRVRWRWSDMVESCYKLDTW